MKVDQSKPGTRGGNVRDNAEGGSGEEKIKKRRVTRRGGARKGEERRGRDELEEDEEDRGGEKGRRGAKAEIREPLKVVREQ